MKVENIPIEKIRVSTLNVRAGEEFGDEEDRELVRNLESQGLLQPIVVRPVGDEYEVVIGRRRFLSLKQSGAREATCIVREMGDEEAMDASLSENIMRRPVDPVTLGKWLKKRLEMTGESLRSYARKIGKPASTLSEWLRMNDLSEGMQRAVSKGLVAFTDALKVARLNIPYEEQERLALKAIEEGAEEFKRELERIRKGYEKRGAPKGLLVVRVSFGTESPIYEALKRLAEEKGMELGEYVKQVLEEHVKSALS